MTKKKINLIITSVLSILLIILVICYYRLLSNNIVLFNMQNTIEKLYGKSTDGHVYNFVYDKKVQFILFILLYGVIFHLINSIVESSVKKGIIAFIMCLVFSLQVFLTDTAINYSSFRNIYGGMSDLTFKGFAMAKLWWSGMSKYGIFSVLINFLFLFSFMLIMIMIKYLFTKGTSANERMSRVNGMMREMVAIENDQDYNDVCNLVELYNFGHISKISLLDFISNLPERDKRGIKCLTYIETHIDDKDPEVIDRIKKEYKKNYSDVEWIFNDSDIAKEDYSVYMERIEKLTLENKG